MILIRPVILFCFLTITLITSGQNGDLSKGSVSYVTSQNIYVKFPSTQGIEPGDTLFSNSNGVLAPAAIVKERSSISCVCIPLSGNKISVSDNLFHRPGTVKQESGKTPAREQTGTPVSTAPAALATGGTRQSSDSLPVLSNDTMNQPAATPAKKSKTRRQQIHGNLSASSYSNFSSNSSTNSQRMKYTFSFLGRNLGNTNLSAECYISYIQNDQQWNELPGSFFNGLKVYSLALNYDFGSKASLLLGRKINPKLSNMGANDGLQFELRFRPVSFGIIAGFRPDYADYGFNSDLFQAGGYIYHELRAKNGAMQTTAAFVEQTNQWKTDRRFVYLQHVNSLVKNLTFFGSAEVDLYRKVLNTADSSWQSESTPKLTNIYLSLNYRVIKELTLSFSYSSRKNVVYYETYKNYLDRLIDPEATQGYLLQVTGRPVRNLAIGASGAYRFQKEDPRPTKNLYTYITYSQIPGVLLDATASFTLLSTSYLGGNIYSLGLSRDIIPGKLFAGIQYRYVDYNYVSAETPIVQNVGEVNLSWRIYKKIALSVYYEGTFEPDTQFNRIYAQFNLGF